MLMSSVDNLQQLYPPSDPLTFADASKRFSEPTAFASSRDDCAAIPFIKFLPAEGRFELNPEAAEFLQSLGNVKLGVVAVCGKYRTGKSYLLNKLFVENYFQNASATSPMSANTESEVSPIVSGGANENDMGGREEETKCQTGSGFQVSPTINPCTKGLWLWKKLIYSEQNQCPMIVIDTEGLGAFDEDENHDAKIFLLALLLSSMIIYNSVGTIDENALNNLSLVINLSKKIQLRNRQETPEDIDELANIFPSFLWVLRDFTLKLVDADGNRISSKQYLENALKEQKGFSEAVEQKNRIRRLLRHFFQERDCCTLIRPTEKEKDLQDLAKMRDSHLRKDFIEQMARIKHKVMTKIKVKVMNGHQLNGPMLVELANSYIEALNQGQVPNIESAWSSVCTFEQERAYKESIKHFDLTVKSKILSSFQDIGFENVKSTLVTIRNETIIFLRSKFLGDSKAIESFEKKLRSELKAQSQLIIKEAQSKIDEQINKEIAKLFQDQIETKVRRECPELDTLDKVQSEIDHLMTVIQIKFLNDGDRIEYLFRKYVQSRIFKLAEMLQDSSTRKSQLQHRLLEEKIKLSEHASHKQKEERKTWVEEQQYEKDKVELERVSYVKQVKVLEQRLRDTEAKAYEMQQVFKAISQKEQKEQSMQTQKEQVAKGVEVCVQASIINPEESNSSFIEISESKMPQTINQIEQNKKLYSDILEALKSQSEQISQTMSDEFSQILRNNEALSKAIESSEKRCLLLEKKVERKRKYETLVKNCQRLQCNGCNKLYTPMLFVSHFLLCKKQQQLRSSIIKDNKSSEIIEEDREDSQTQDEQFLAKIVDMKQICVDTRDGQVSEECFISEVSATSDELVTIGRTTSPLKIPNQHQYSTVQFKVCVLLGGQLWYIFKTLVQIKALMNKVQRDKDNSEQEQCQIAKWLLEIERNEIEENYQRIAEIIESCFQMIHMKISDNKLSLTSRFITVEDVESRISKHLYHQEFIQFFEIREQLQRKQYQSQDNNDDEVIVQMTYEDNDDLKNSSDDHFRRAGRKSAIGATIQSAISELCGVSGHRPQGFGLTASGGHYVNHSTIHLDGEKSLNDNSSLHFVSFFSVAEDLLMKRNLGGTLSHMTSQDDEQSVSCCGAENFMRQSPEKPLRDEKPFGSISNRPCLNGAFNAANAQMQSPFQKQPNTASKKSARKAGYQQNVNAMNQAKACNTATKRTRGNQGIMYTE